jgi:hypothetical protein
VKECGWDDEKGRRRERGKAANGFQGSEHERRRNRQTQIKL